MSTRPRDVDVLVASLRDYVQALVDHREGRIGVGPTVVTARQNFRDALRAVFGMKVAEDAEP
jgi:hypothetical protein